LPGAKPPLYTLSINTLKKYPLRGLGSPLSIFKTFYYRIYNKDITNIYNKYIEMFFLLKCGEPLPGAKPPLYTLSINTLIKKNQKV
jgi:hypothetical protein